MAVQSGAITAEISGVLMPKGDTAHAGESQGQNLLPHDTSSLGVIKMAGYARHLFSMAHLNGIIQHKSTVPARCLNTSHRLSCNPAMQVTPLQSSRFNAAYRASFSAQEKVFKDSRANMPTESTFSQTQIISQYTSSCAGVPERL